MYALYLIVEETQGGKMYINSPFQTLNRELLYIFSL